jgi:hypothetical protein
VSVGGEGAGLSSGRRQTLAETVQQVQRASSPANSENRTADNVISRRGPPQESAAAAHDRGSNP